MILVLFLIYFDNKKDIEGLCGIYDFCINVVSRRENLVWWIVLLFLFLEFKE